MTQLYNAFTLFLSLLVEALPFLLLGILLSSVLLFFVDERQLVARMPRNPLLGAVMGSCIGFLFPVCECGNVPVARRLLAQGVPTAVAIGFLLAAPTINPIVIWATWVAFRDQPEIVVLRVVFSLTVAIIVAGIFGIQKDPQPLLKPELAKRVALATSARSPQPGPPAATPVPALLQSGTFLLGQGPAPLRLDQVKTEALLPEPQRRRFTRRKWLACLNNAVQELRELGGMLVVGSAIAASIQVFVPREIIVSLGQGPLTSILAMMLLAAVVSICSTVDAFFVLAFAATFTTGSLLSFLVFGPMIDLKAIGLMLSIFKPRFIAYLFALAGQLTLLLTLAYSYFF